MMFGTPRIFGGPWWDIGKSLAAPSYPVDHGGPSGVRKAQRAAIKRKNKGRAKRG